MSPPRFAELSPPRDSMLCVATPVTVFVAPLVGLVLRLCLVDWMTTRKPPEQKPDPGDAT